MYRELFWPVLAPSMLIGVATGATVPVSVLAALELGASAALASLIIAVVGAAALATTVVAGRFIDRVGDRRAMLLSTGGGAVCTALTVAALAWGGTGALALFVVSVVLRAPVMNVWNLSRQALVAEHVPTVQRGRAMTALGGTMRAGSLVGPLLGAVLLLRLPTWSVYVLSMVCALLALAILYTRAGSALDVAARQRAGKASSPSRATGATDQHVPAVRWRAVVLAGVAVATLAVARVAQPVGVQLWGVQLGLTASTISLLVAIGAAVELVMMFPGGALKDHLGRAPVLVLCLAVYGAGFALMPLVPHLAGMVVAVLVMALGNGLGAGINMTIGADLSPAVGRARFLGVWALFSNVGVLVGPALISGLVGVGSVRLALLGVATVAWSGAAWMGVWARAADLPRGVGRGA
jgi:MFS family permease